MLELILYKNGLEDDDSRFKDAIDLLNQKVGRDNYVVKEGEPEVPVLNGEPPYLEVNSGLDKNNPTHSYNNLEDVLEALDYETGSDEDTDLGTV